MVVCKKSNGNIGQVQTEILRRNKSCVSFQCTVPGNLTCDHSNEKLVWLKQPCLVYHLFHFSGIKEKRFTIIIQKYNNSTKKFIGDTHNPSYKISYPSHLNKSS